jgi:chromosome segregation ATPase
MPFTVGGIARSPVAGPLEPVNVHVRLKRYEGTKEDHTQEKITLKEIAETLTSSLSGWRPGTTRRRREVRPIHASLADINRRLEALEEHYANLKGVTKEIDEIRAEVHAIQKHLGIDRKIAA